MSEPETSCPSCSFHMRVCEGEREGKGKREREMVSRCCLSGVTHPFQSLLTTECSMDGAQSVHTHTHTHTCAQCNRRGRGSIRRGKSKQARTHTHTHTDVPVTPRPSYTHCSRSVLCSLRWHAVQQAEWEHTLPRSLTGRYVVPQHARFFFLPLQQWLRIGTRSAGSALLTLSDVAAERMRCKASPHNANSLSQRSAPLSWNGCLSG